MRADARADLRHALDPAAFAIEALGITPDPWQHSFLRSTARRQILLCSRQSGKSTVAAIAALHRALFYPQSLVLVVSPSIRQSGELFRKIVHHVTRLAVAPDLSEESRLSMRLANGSRVLSLPSSPETIRGFSAASLVIEDEAAFVDDDCYVAIRPMLAVSKGRLVLMSTPFGRRGHFYREWSSGGGQWERFSVTAAQCPRISPEFLAEERESLGAWRWLQEYGAEFVESDDQLFAIDLVQAAIASDVEPLLFGLAHA
ncbi:MAG: hypothetical protein HYV09_07865 [Deltaproteobacteria bacterium]|nr:hypothetical protein [Deltaproteobacteria bacterium]